MRITKWGEPAEDGPVSVEFVDYEWHYCGSCGELTQQTWEGGERVCSQCGDSDDPYFKNWHPRDEVPTDAERNR